MRAPQLFGLSRNRPVPWDLRRTSNSVTNEDFLFGFLRNHFSSSPSISVLPGKRRATLRGGWSAFFRGNQFSSFLWLRRFVREARDQTRRGRRISFSAEPLFLIPPRRDRRPRKPKDPACWGAELFFAGTTFPHSFRPRRALWSGRSEAPGAPCFFQGEPLFLIPFVCRNAIDRTPTISGRTPSSSSRQGDSEILAVRKTGAWVLRLLPPTS